METRVSLKYFINDCSFCISLSLLAAVKGSSMASFEESIFVSRT